jgi:Dolichyl-phosphate-mannose-protein mannosyltransferase
MTEQNNYPGIGTIAGSILPRYLRTIADSKYTPWLMAVVYIVFIGVLALSFHRIGNYEVETDFYWTYIPNAQAILGGNLIVDDYKGPGYPLILAVGKLFIDEFFRTGILISVFSGGIFILAIYLLMKKVFSPDVAFLVSCALICNTAFIRYSYTASTDMPFAALIAFLIYLSVRNDNFKIVDMLLCGLVSGFAYLIRYNAIFIMIAFGFVLFVFNVKKVSISLRLKGLLVYGVAAAVFIIPWMVYSHAVTGDYFYQKNHLNTAYEIYGKGLMGWDQWWAKEAPRFQSLSDVLFHDPMLMLQRLLINLGEHFVNDMFWLIGIWWGVFAIGGLYAVARQRLNGQQLAIFVFSGIYFLSLVPFFYSDRFSLPLIPFYILVAILFLLWITRRIIYHRWIYVGLLIFLGLIGTSLYRTVKYNVAQISSGPNEVLEIANKYGTLHKGSEGDKQVILARKPQIAYYLNMAFHPIPLVSSTNELLEYCIIHNIDYVFASTVEANLRPELSSLLDLEHPPGGLYPVVRTVSGDAILYRVRGKRAK